jgi:DNA-binding response OmpR family regulator
MSTAIPPILLVEDDQDLGGVLAEYLRLKKFQVKWVQSGEKALEILNENWLILILDVSLPGISGFEVAERLQKTGSNTPFLFLTAKGQKKDRIHGLKMGADDYITKPFEVEELLLRIKNILKRANLVNDSSYELPGLSLDKENLILKVHDKTFDLTEKEASLLALFLNHQGQLLKRDFILNEIWGDDDYFNGRSMDVFISRIRKYLSGIPQLSIDNVRGVGFKLVRN